MTALFVIFLGIIPALVLLAFLTYYVKHNVLHFRSPKSPAPTYVKECLFSSFQHVFSACRGGSSLSNNSSIRTVSESVNNRSNNLRNMEIKQTGLISTTNNDVITRSNTITKNTNRESGGVRRLSLKNIKGLKLNTSLRTKNKECGSSRVDCETPATTETVCFDKSPVMVVSVKDLAKKFNKPSENA